MTTYMTLLVLTNHAEIEDTVGVFPHSALEVKQDRAFFAQIVDYHNAPPPLVRTQPIPANFWLYWYKNDHIKRTRTNAGDEELVWAPAREFKKLVVPYNGHPFHKALKAYIEQLPDTIPIIVWLH